MNIAIVEDDCLIREALGVVCERQMGCAVAGSAGSGRAAAELLLRVRADVVVLDWVLPDMDGGELLARVRPWLPGLRVLVVSGRLDERTVAEVSAAAVHGFVDKASNPVESFRAAVAAVAAGRTYFAASYEAARRALREDPRCAAKLLSPAERAVLALVGEGGSNAEIAAQLGIAELTAQTHRRNLFAKLGIAGTPRLTVYAIRRGFTRG